MLKNIDKLYVSNMENLRDNKPKNYNGNRYEDYMYTESLKSKQEISDYINGYEFFMKKQFSEKPVKFKDPQISIRCTFEAGIDNKDNKMDISISVTWPTEKNGETIGKTAIQVISSIDYVEGNMRRQVTATADFRGDDNSNLSRDDIIAF